MEEEERLAVTREMMASSTRGTTTAFQRRASHLHICAHTQTCKLPSTHTLHSSSLTSFPDLFPLAADYLVNTEVVSVQFRMFIYHK